MILNFVEQFKKDFQKKEISIEKKMADTIDKLSLIHI